MFCTGLTLSSAMLELHLHKISMQLNLDESQWGYKYHKNLLYWSIFPFHQDMSSYSLQKLAKHLPTYYISIFYIIPSLIPFKPLLLQSYMSFSEKDLSGS